MNEKRPPYSPIIKHKDWNKKNNKKTKRSKAISENNIYYTFHHNKSSLLEKIHHQNSTNTIPIEDLFANCINMVDKYADLRKKDIPFNKKEKMIEFQELCYGLFYIYMWGKKSNKEYHLLSWYFKEVGIGFLNSAEDIYAELVRAIEGYWSSWSTGNPDSLPTIESESTLLKIDEGKHHSTDDPTNDDLIKKGFSSGPKYISNQYGDDFSPLGLFMKPNIHQNAKNKPEKKGEREKILTHLEIASKQFVETELPPVHLITQTKSLPLKQNLKLKKISLFKPPILHRSPALEVAPKPSNDPPPVPQHQKLFV